MTGRGDNSILNLRFHHIAVICSDYERSKSFYRDTLGFAVVSEVYREERKSWKLNLAIPGGGQIELFTFPDAPPRPSYPEAQGLRHLAFGVFDIDACMDSLRQKGIVTELIRVDALTKSRFFFFEDPDGLPIEIYETTAEEEPVQRM